MTPNPSYIIMNYNGISDYQDLETCSEHLLTNLVKLYKIHTNIYPRALDANHNGLDVGPFVGTLVLLLHVRQVNIPGRNELMVTDLIFSVGGS